MIPRSFLRKPAEFACGSRPVHRDTVSLVFPPELFYNLPDRQRPHGGKSGFSAKAAEKRI